MRLDCWEGSLMDFKIGGGVAYRGESFIWGPKPFPYHYPPWLPLYKSMKSSSSTNLSEIKLCEEKGEWLT